MVPQKPNRSIAKYTRNAPTSNEGAIFKFDLSIEAADKNWEFLESFNLNIEEAF